MKATPTEDRVSLGRQLRSLAGDRGKTSPTAARELERLAEEADGLVTATQLPAPGPEDDGATRAELADAVRHAQEPQPALGGESPVDRILRVLATARALVKAQGLATIFPGPMHDLANALEALDQVLLAEARESGQPEPGHWHPATWKDVKTGDRIRVGGQHEAEVDVAMEVTWLGSGAAQVPVKLKGRGHYTMPPSGPVEVWVPALADWAAEAFATLAAAGLESEVTSHG